MCFTTSSTSITVWRGNAGIVFLSTSYIRHRIERGVSGNRKGYNEIYSRIGRKFYELEPTDGTDVASICRANGLDNVRQISNVIKATEKSDFDLRCVKKRRAQGEKDGRGQS